MRQSKRFSTAAPTPHTQKNRSIADELKRAALVVTRRTLQHTENAKRAAHYSQSLLARTEPLIESIESHWTTPSTPLYTRLAKR